MAELITPSSSTRQRRRRLAGPAVGCLRGLPHGLVSDRCARMHWTLSDPDGNEVDIATWQGRD